MFILMTQVSIVSVHLRSIRAVVKSQKRDLTVDGYVSIISYQLSYIMYKCDHIMSNVSRCL